MHSPKIAIIDPNTLAALGLRQLLQTTMPIATVHTFRSISELMTSTPDSFVHFFASSDVILANRPFFQQRLRKTIAVTTSTDDVGQLTGYKTICTSLPERELTRQLLILQQRAHHGGRNLPPSVSLLPPSLLTPREVEVMVLIVQGYINKQIADRLSIALATVITHRRNIMQKLGIRSVAALTIYAVTHGYVDISEI